MACKIALASTSTALICLILASVTPASAQTPTPAQTQTQTQREKQDNMNNTLPADQKRDGATGPMGPSLFEKIGQQYKNQKGNLVDGDADSGSPKPTGSPKLDASPRPTPYDWNNDPAWRKRLKDYEVEIKRCGDNQHCRGEANDRLTGKAPTRWEDLGGGKGPPVDQPSDNDKKPPPPKQQSGNSGSPPPSGSPTPASYYMPPGEWDWDPSVQRWRCNRDCGSDSPKNPPPDPTKPASRCHSGAPCQQNLADPRSASAKPSGKTGSDSDKGKAASASSGNGPDSGNNGKTASHASGAAGGTDTKVKNSHHNARSSADPKASGHGTGISSDRVRGGGSAVKLDVSSTTASRAASGAASRAASQAASKAASNAASRAATNVRIPGR